MRPVHFKWKKSGEEDIGFIAEEVDALDPVLSQRKDGRVEGVKYSQLTSLIVNAIQEFVVKVKTSFEKQDQRISQLSQEKDSKI